MSERFLQIPGSVHRPALDLGFYYEGLKQYNICKMKNKTINWYISCTDRFIKVDFEHFGSPSKIVEKLKTIPG